MTLPIKHQSIHHYVEEKKLKREGMSMILKQKMCSIQNNNQGFMVFISIHAIKYNKKSRTHMTDISNVSYKEVENIKINYALVFGDIACPSVQNLAIKNKRKIRVRLSCLGIVVMNAIFYRWHFMPNIFTMMYIG